MGRLLPAHLRAPVLAAFAMIVVCGIAYTFLSLFPGQGLARGPVTFLDGLYFSVVTISSLGYGDLHPVGVARALASIEVLGGLLLVGVLVSRLVSQKQEEMLEYLERANVIHAFDRDLDALRDAKEELADRNREMASGVAVPPQIFARRRAHAFYSVSRTMEALTSYSLHVLRANQAFATNSCL